MKYPDDVDGDVLRSLQDKGNDMSAPMLIDFHIDCPHEASADYVIAHLASKDFASSKSENEEGDRWTVNIPVEMIPDHYEIVYFQNVLRDGLKKFGAKPDGWGTFGNKEKRNEQT